MLKKLFESLDDKVFTSDLKESLEIQFNEAVEEKANLIAEERIEEEIDVLAAKSEDHIDFLTEKAEEFVEIKRETMLESVDAYLERIVENFVEEAKDSLDESITSERADLVIEAFDSMLTATGVKVASIVEARDESSVESELQESTDKYDRLIDENISIKEENETLIKMGVIAELCEGLSIVESEKFERLANLVEFSRDAEFGDKLDTIKESVMGSSKNTDGRLNESGRGVKTAKPVWSHLV